MLKAACILLALAAVSIVLVTPVAASMRDTGYDLAAGYRYSISLHICYVGTSLARAGIDAGIIKIDFRYPALGSPPHLKITINDNTVFDQDISSEDVTVYITVDWDGSGQVEVSGYGNVGGFSLDHSYRIMAFSETASWGFWSCSSSVTISRQQLPRNESNPLAPVEEQQPLSFSFDFLGALGSAATLGVVLVIVLFGLLALVIAFSQARRHKLV